MIKKTKFSTITAVLATIAAIAAMGSIGGGIGLGQQQMALAQVDSRDIGGDETNVGGIGDTIRGIVEDELDDDNDRQRLCPGEFYVDLGAAGYICLGVDGVLSDIGQDFP